MKIADSVLTGLAAISKGYLEKEENRANRALTGTRGYGRLIAGPRRGLLETKPIGVFMKSNFWKLGLPLLVIMSTVNWFMEVFTGGVTWLLA